MCLHSSQKSRTNNFGLKTTDCFQNGEFALSKTTAVDTKNHTITGAEEDCHLSSHVQERN